MTKFKSVTSRNTGALQSWQKISNGITGKTSTAHLQVVFYTEHIVRITFSQESFIESFSYSVVAEPDKLQIDVQEDQDSIRLRSSFVQIRVSKNPVRITFLNNSNQVINEDETLGTTWNGEQVTTHKRLQEGERFIGLGENLVNLWMALQEVFGDG